MRTSWTIPGCPAAKPRMTSSDRWKERPAVVAYRLWANEVRLVVTGNPMKKLDMDVLGIVAFFHLPIPEAWGSIEKAAAYGRLHRGKKDADNLGKGLMDALLAEDKTVAFVQFYKLHVEENQSPRTDIFLLVK